MTETWTIYQQEAGSVQERRWAHGCGPRSRRTDGRMEILEESDHGVMVKRHGLAKPDDNRAERQAVLKIRCFPCRLRGSVPCSTAGRKSKRGA